MFSVMYGNIHFSGLCTAHSMRSSKLIDLLACWGAEKHRVGVVQASLVCLITCLRSKDARCDTSFVRSCAFVETSVLA